MRRGVRAARKSRAVRHWTDALERPERLHRHDDAVVPGRTHDPSRTVRSPSRSRLCRPFDRSLPDVDSRLRSASRVETDAQARGDARDDFQLSGWPPHRASMVCARLIAPLERRLCDARAADRRGHLRGAMSPAWVSCTSRNSSNDRPSPRNSSSDFRNP